MSHSKFEPFDGCFYVSLRAIQEELDSYYEKHGTCLSLPEAIMRLHEQNRYHSQQRNQQVIRLLYHHDFDEFLNKIGDLRMEVDYPSIQLIQDDVTAFCVHDSVDVFLNLSFHHVREQSHKAPDFEICFVYRGTYRFQFPGEERILKEGDIVFVSPGAEYTISETSPDAFRVSFYANYNTLSQSFLSIMKKQDLLSGFLKEVLANQNRPNYLFMSAGNIISLKYLMQSMILEQFKYDNYSPECSLSWLKIFFANVLRDYHDFHQYSDCGIRIDFGPVLEYLISNYRTLTLGQMAEHFSYSPSYLSSMIRKVTGKTFSQIVKEYRLKEAQGYLEHTRKSIAEISELCGYNDADHFSKTFRSSFGCSPQQYRKKLAAVNPMKE